jgi:branched-chain amino acid transport system ATP-binding protein
VLLATDDLCVSYGGLRAVDRLNVEVRAGQIVGLIGPNGAGKTTTIDALTGFTSAAGAVRFLGDPIGDLTPHARARRGLVRTWQSIEIFDDLTVAENLRVARERASVGSVLLDIVHPVRHTDDTDVEWALELIGLTHYADARPSTLSLGQKKLLGVARALAAGPKVVLLDEPAAGLDSAESQALGERLLDVVEHGIAILLVDHDMGLVLNVCDEIYVLDFGRLLAHGTASEIRDNDDVIAAYLGEEARAAKAARTAPTTSTAASVEEVSR